MSAEDFFKALENEITEDRMQDMIGKARMRVRAISELAAGVEVDAVEAGLSKDIARKLSIAVIEQSTGYSLR